MAGDYLGLQSSCYLCDVRMRIAITFIIRGKSIKEELNNVEVCLALELSNSKYKSISAAIGFGRDWNRAGYHGNQRMKEEQISQLTLKVIQIV